jgi:hypothetical protein
MKRLVSSTWFRIAAIILVLPATLIFCGTAAVLVTSPEITSLFPAALPAIRPSPAAISVLKHTMKFYETLKTGTRHGYGRTGRSS